VAKQPLLSIIITSYTVNRLKDIFELLDSIKKQTYQNFEVIFVVEKSYELLARVKEYASKTGLNSMRIIFNNSKLGLSEARNLGIKEAKGEIIAFVDDDVVLVPNWAEELIETFAMSNNVIGVTGPALPLCEDVSIDWLPEEFHWVISCTSWVSFDDMKDVRNVWGHNFAFRKEVFSIVGLLSSNAGFSYGTTLALSPIGEDLEFSIRARMKTKGRILYNQKVKVWHKVSKQKTTVRYIAERAYWIGRSRGILKYLYEEEDNGLLSTEYSLLKRIVTKLPTKILKTIFSRPIDGLKMGFITIIVMISIALGYVSSFHLCKLVHDF
jgi:GT2 family glycosyltransferase